MIHLSERLEKIVRFIKTGDRVADIGTDHGYIPIYLKQSGKSDYIVAGDINEGPLEKMAENLEKHLGDNHSGIYMRLGAGLDVIESGEVDSVVIAGMGGLLIADILGADRKKSYSVKRFVLQPRNAQDKLRKWLIDNGYCIVDEVLAREGRFVWEIICVEPVDLENQSINNGADELDKGLYMEYFGDNIEQYEVGQWIIKKHDPLIRDFINNKLSVERKIAENTAKSSSSEAVKQKRTALGKIKILEGILKDVNK